MIFLLKNTSNTVLSCLLPRWSVYESSVEQSRTVFVDLGHRFTQINECNIQLVLIFVSYSVKPFFFLENSRRTEKLLQETMAPTLNRLSYRQVALTLKYIALWRIILLLLSSAITSGLTCMRCSKFSFSCGFCVCMCEYFFTVYITFYLVY